MTSITGDVLSDMGTLGEHSVNLIFSDPPYNLGSEVVVDPADGKMKFRGTAKDFMGKWEFGHEQWEAFFREAYRIMKYGGYCVLFSLDRQTALVKYYAHLAGFEEQQSLYWFFASGFPKALNIGKGVDKKLGLEREVVGSKLGMPGYSLKDNDTEVHERKAYGEYCDAEKECQITAPASEIAKKWDGYYAGIAPLKPSMETILVFRKPYARGNHVSNLMEYEAGDESISPSVVNIEGCRVPHSEECKMMRAQTNIESMTGGGKYQQAGRHGDVLELKPEGRYPSQLYVDSGAAELLDAQSGVTKSGLMKANTQRSTGGGYHGGFPGNATLTDTYGDEGGCSRILHHCDYEDEELELVYFASKVSRSERNAGLTGREKRPMRWSSGTQNPGSFQSAGTDRSAVNPHPSLKPLSLLSRIASLFRFPAGVPQSVYVPFAGTFSEVIGLQQAGYDMSLVRACEKSAEYVEIGRARYEYWSTRSVEKRQGKGTSKAVRAAKSAAEVDGAFCSDESEESA